MKKLSRAFYRQTTRGFPRVYILLLSILFYWAVSACNGNAGTFARVTVQTSDLTNPPTSSPAETAVSPALTLAPSTILPPTAVSVTVAPAAEPTTAPDEGWKTYTSILLGIAVDYPQDWQAQEDSSGVTFSSTEGSSIKLIQVQTGNLSAQAYLNNSDLPNMRCSNGANLYGLRPQVCFDTITFSTTANLIVENGASKLVALVMGRNGDKPVFDRMAMTLRSIPKAP